MERLVKPPRVGWGQVRQGGLKWCRSECYPKNGGRQVSPELEHRSYKCWIGLLDQAGRACTYRLHQTRYATEANERWRQRWTKWHRLFPFVWHVVHTQQSLDPKDIKSRVHKYLDGNIWMGWDKNIGIVKSNLHQYFFCLGRVNELIRVRRQQWKQEILFWHLRFWLHFWYLHFKSA